jgi:hypothetical protein
MTMYFVLSVFTSSPISLQVTTKASVFFFIVCILPHHHHEPEADVYHLISSHPGLPESS